MNKKIKSKLDQNEITVGVVGLGYVGLPLALNFSMANLNVIGFETNKKYISQVNGGQSYISHISNIDIKAAKKNGLEATDNFRRITECDFIILCLPTPLNTHREPDLSFVINSMTQILPFMRKGQALSLESTTYPGTTDEIIAPMIEARKFVIGKDVHLIYSPEREDPGNKDFALKSIPKVVGGMTQNCLKAGVALYSKIIDSVVPVSSTRVAEMTKLLENIHRSVNIGLVNEMKIISDSMNIDINEVITAASTKPFGFVPYRPGPGLGGHCIPIDPFYLSWKAKEYGLNARFIELAGEINLNMPNWVINKLTVALNQQKIPISKSKILILGVAYKKNVSDIRESPSITIIEKLMALNANVSYSDEYVSSINDLENTKKPLKSKVITSKLLQSLDCVLLATDHDNFDYELIKKHSKLIIDTRGKFKKSRKIIQA
jgi:UDP-N-acetyl-D-glucosamine dehydrogenase